MSSIVNWMKRKLQDAPRVTRDESEACGHPHSWCGLVIPDWEWRQMIDEAARENEMSKSWEVKRLIVNTESSKVPHSVCCDGVEKYVLPDLSRAQAESIERMLNLIVASHATIS